MAGEGLHIVWDPSIDHGAWPGPLGDRHAAAGVAWLGPIGLLARLETELGLAGNHPTSLARAAALAPALATRTGWWRASYDVDPLGTAQRLLRDRDLLAMWGWRGEPTGARLDELWAATRDAAPGIPDRLARVTEALASRPIDVAVLDARSSPARLEPLWQRLLVALAAAGVRIEEHPTAAAPARGDLAAARTAGFTPRGDGGLTLLRPHGPLAAADELAASLAALPSLDGVVVIGGDDVLDAALARHGVPRLGARGRPAASTALLRLVIEAAFEPMEPAELHALLSLAPGPIPRRIATRLRDALGAFPSRRAPTWEEALRRGVERCEPDWRADAEARVRALLTPAAGLAGPIARADLDHRLDVLASWAQAGIPTTPSLALLTSLVAEARALIAAEPDADLTLVRLRRLCDELEPTGGPGLAGQAGLAAVAEPGALLAPARIVVWWSFTRASAPAAPRLRLAEAERAALAAAGVTPPDLGALMEGIAGRWRRPLELATEALILVCPLTSDAGEPAFPHPLWDELTAAMVDGKLAARVTTARLARPAPARRATTLRARPVPATAIRVPAPVPLRAKESPSSLERLLGCSLAWALHYHGRLRAGLAEPPPAPSPLLYGTLAHDILARVFADGALDAAAAEARAHALVETELRALCESLALPRYQVELSAVRQAIVRTARGLGELLATSGASVRGVELDLEGELDGIALTGTADLVLGAPDAVLDLKWGKSSNRKRLEAGAALQLAIYAELLRRRGKLPEVGYFTLQSQELLSARGARLAAAKVIGAATAHDTWEGARVALRERQGELAAGQLRAPAADGSDHESGLAGKRLTIAPGCEYCAFGALCGKDGAT